jgi:hypothetical protein
MRDLRPQNRAARRRARRLRRSLGLGERKGVLAALSASALLLPGFARAQEERWTVDYAYSLYSEDDIDSSKMLAGVGSAERYDIDTHLLSLKGPITGRLDFGVDFLHETMSGATPWYVQEDVTTNEPVVVMTEASIEDQRTDVNARGIYYFDTTRMNLQGGYSTEDDYNAINLGFGMEHDFGEKNTTLSWGLGLSMDEIDPTPDDDDTTPLPESEDKRTISVFGGWSQVMGRSTIFQTILSYQNGDGFLSDPYKLVSIAGENEPDARPDSRSQYAVLARLRRHFEGVSGTAHVDYRFYYDDWGVLSHTAELAWYQSLFGDVLHIIPSVRYYSQSQADFYAPFFESALAPGADASSDYRLSPYGALSGKLRVEAHVTDWPFHMAWKIGASYERYQSSGSLALGSVDVENPGLVSFNVIMINLSARF